MARRLLILNTGGTIGMKPAATGYQPAPGFLARQLAEFPELRGDQLPAFDIIEYDPLLDSADFTPADWRRIASDIAGHYDRYDGFVVLHGTDTMAWTASALPFMLEGLDKNIILTGSQLPLCLRRSDARENLITAMIVAGEYDVPEVCVLFGSVLLRGCRTTKISATRFDAFESPNWPPLASIGTYIRVFPEQIRFPPTRGTTGVQLRPIDPEGFATMRLFPGLSAPVMENVLQTPLRALILESYGSGNGPSGDREFLRVVRDAVDRGIVVVNLSQCRHGGVSPTEYATGRALHDAGVVSGGDMTVEAAMTKLMYLFGQSSDGDTVKRLMQQDLVGELTGEA